MADPQKSVFDPQTVATSAYRVIEERAATPHLGIRTGVKSIDEVLNPHRPGELRVVLGYTSNYKSGLMSYISRHAARQIEKRENDERRVVVTVTWEQSAEEQGIVDLAQATGLNVTRMMRGELGDADWSALRKAAVKRGIMPWWLIGHSANAHERRPRLSMTDIAEGLAYLVDVQGLTIELLCLDYLQRIRRENDNGNPRLGFMEIVDRCKDAALAFNCPVLLGAQAGRQVKTRKWRLPQAEDGQETSNLEQSADSLLSVWMPKHDYPDGEEIEYGSMSVPVSPNLLICGVLKQKFGTAPHVLPLHVRPEVNEITPMEVNQVQL